MEAEALAVLSNTQAFLDKFMLAGIGESLNGQCEGMKSWDQFPCASTLEYPSRQTFLSSGEQQTAIEFSEFTFALIIGARQVR